MTNPIIPEVIPRFMKDKIDKRIAELGEKMIKADKNLKELQSCGHSFSRVGYDVGIIRACEDELEFLKTFGVEE